MTTAGTDDHPEVDEISAFAEGLLAPERTVEVGSHLAHCVLCADVRHSLDEVRALLGHFPGPPRVPDEVASRIDAALTTEALLRAREPQDAGAPAPAAQEDSTPRTAAGHEVVSGAASGAPGTTAPPVGAPAPGTHVSRETSPAPDRPATRPGDSSGPGRSSRGARRRWRVLTAVAGVALLGLGGVLTHQLLGTHNTVHPTAVGPRTTGAGTFSGVALPAKVHELLGNATPQAQPNAATGGENSPFASTPPAAPACVLKATGRPETTPIATSRGAYEGRPSYLVVIPDPADPRGRVDAFVVDAACAAQGASGGTTGTVLAHGTYDRG